jgi:hypothetical protein
MMLTSTCRGMMTHRIVVVVVVAMVFSGAVVVVVLLEMDSDFIPQNTTTAQNSSHKVTFSGSIHSVDCDTIERYHCFYLFI